ncbi:hypothetical protein [Sediminibacterium sp.]|uniref:hypothetical protein n=1 Tax=Sediminibacterium sp. TaxID=1917865 RepID=UPI00273287C0|nr:hypothetical protein [Sediminibacterium sp.]MDP3394510.1 hypothetical protein [Sediminibacterium sp.]MDP3568345.1 hypothetical protein [Sediminibacterium sp.]
MKNLFLFLSMVFLISCKKDPVPNPIPNPDLSKKLLKKISTDPLEFQLFTYNNNKDLTNYTIQYINNVVDRTVSKLETSLTYESGKLVKQQSLTGTQEYYYTLNRLDSIRSTAITGRWISTIIPTINEQNKLVSILELMKPNAYDAPNALRIDYVYDALGNLIDEKTYCRYQTGPQFVLVDHTVFLSYDNKNNAEGYTYSSTFIPGIVMMKNNPGKVVSYATNNSVTYEANYTYKYDADGYVTERKKRLIGSNVELTFTYEYY